MDKSITKINIKFKHVLLFISVLILMGATIVKDTNTIIMISDISFILGMVFILIACSRIVRNLGIFDIVKYSFKTVFSLVNNKDNGKVSNEKIDYVDYKASNIHRDEYKRSLFFGILLLVLSGLFTVL